MNYLVPMCVLYDILQMTELINTLLNIRVGGNRDVLSLVAKQFVSTCFSSAWLEEYDCPVGRAVRLTGRSHLKLASFNRLNLTRTRPDQLFQSPSAPSHHATTTIEKLLTPVSSLCGMHSKFLNIMHMT